jgi:hypothetical protein
VAFVHVPAIRRGPTPASARRRRLRPADLDRAGTALVMAVVAAARRARRQGLHPHPR